MVRPSIAIPIALGLASLVLSAPAPASAAASREAPAPETSPTTPASPETPSLDTPSPGTPSPDAPSPDPAVPAPPEPAPGVTPAPGAPSDPSTNEADKRVGVGIDAVVVLPVGDFATSTGALGGPLVRFGYRVVAGFELSMRAGYLFAASKGQGNGVVSKLDILPLWLEARWLFLRPFSGPYGAVSGGVNIYVPTVTPPIPGPDGDRVTETRRRLGASFGAGYILSDDLPIDLRAQVMMFNLIGQDERLQETEDIGLALTVGYTFQF